jgi:hypothetical protein
MKEGHLRRASKDGRKGAGGGGASDGTTPRMVKSCIGSSFCFFEIGCYCVAQAGSQVILLPHPPNS